MTTCIVLGSKDTTKCLKPIVFLYYLVISHLDKSNTSQLIESTQSPIRYEAIELICQNYDNS